MFLALAFNSTGKTISFTLLTQFTFKDKHDIHSYWDKLILNLQFCIRISIKVWFYYLHSRFNYNCNYNYNFYLYLHLYLYSLHNYMMECMNGNKNEYDSEN